MKDYKEQPPFNPDEEETILLCSIQGQKHIYPLRWGYKNQIASCSPCLALVRS